MGGEWCVSAVRGNQNEFSLTVLLPDSPKEKLIVEIPIKERWETVTSPDTLSDKKAGALLLSPAHKDFVINLRRLIWAGLHIVIQKEVEKGSEKWSDRPV